MVLGAWVLGWGSGWGWMAEGGRRDDVLALVVLPCSRMSGMWLLVTAHIEGCCDGSAIRTMVTKFQRGHIQLLEREFHKGNGNGLAFLDATTSFPLKARYLGSLS
jgi:hypothetical protein